MSENKIAVSVICNAYNHEKYIADALESFVMQKTSFAFEVLVHDDASTDGTADIERFSALTLDPNFFALLDCIPISVILFGQKKFTVLSGIALLFLCISGFFTFSKIYSCSVCGK